MHLSWNTKKSDWLIQHIELKIKHMLGINCFRDLFITEFIGALPKSSFHPERLSGFWLIVFRVQNNKVTQPRKLFIMLNDIT